MCVLITQWCPTLCDPMDRGPPGFLHPWNSPGKNIGVGCDVLLPGDLSDPGIETWSSKLHADSLLSKPLGTPPYQMGAIKK